MALQAWQFQPETYGAKGDGFTAGDVSVNGTATITSPTVAAKGKVGQYIMIHGGLGTTAGPSICTITGIAGNNVTLAAANGSSTPSATASNLPAVCGTDDTAAINAALAAAKTYALANQYFAQVFFSPSIYVLGAAPTQQGNGTSTPTTNAQVVIPWPDPSNTGQKLVIELLGAGDCGYLQFWQSLIPNVTGTALVTMQNPSSGTANNATFGRQSVIGGPSGGAGFSGSTPGFANVKVVVAGVGVWCPIYHNLIGFDFGALAAMRAEESAAHVFAPTGVNLSAAQPYLNNITATGLTNAISIGWRCPVAGNNADISMHDCAVEGYEIGFLVFDHFDAHKLNAIYCDVIMKSDGTQGVSGTQHGIFVSSITAEAYNGGLLSNGGAYQVHINWDAEVTPGAYDFNLGSAMYGLIRFGDKVDNRAPIIGGNGATTVKIINENQAPGHMASPPAVPASTSAATVQWRDAMVAIHTGAGVTVSAVTVDGTATGQTIAASSTAIVMVPSGKTIALTYAGGTPTWDWWLS